MAHESGNLSHKQDLFTTHQVAKLLGVSLPTVVNWCKLGKLSAHRTPGGHRRIPHKELLRFAKAYDYPVANLLKDAENAVAEQGGLLIVSSEADFADLVVDYLTLKRNYTIRLAEAPLVAGMMLGRFSPQVLLWDEATPGLDLVGMDAASGGSRMPRPRLILIVDFLTLEHRAAMESGRLYAVLQKPVSLDFLLESLDRAYQVD